ncbi:MAG: Hpt domain-containing protein [Bryobacteraceae bacterium]
MQNTAAAGWDRKRMLEQLAGDEPLLQEIVQAFLEETPKMMASLRDAVRDANAGGVERTAHSLKLVLGYLGRPVASQTVRELEQMGRNGELKGAAEAFAITEAEIAAVTASMMSPAV